MKYPGHDVGGAATRPEPFDAGEVRDKFRDVEDPFSKKSEVNVEGDLEKALDSIANSIRQSMEYKKGEANKVRFNYNRLL
ncbi:hypothetical protein AGMMS50276_26900 [Synergistales bacterium]|nr:hypothetical protein AGMMS50276_26900 [Synergistales bacterium]